MATIAAELKNLITGDDSSYQAAAKRTEVSLAALQAKAAQTTASVAASFNGFSAPVNGAAAAFSGLGNTVNQAFQSMGTSSQAASGVMSASLNGVAAAAAVVPKSLAAISTEAQGIGAAVSSNGSAAAAALAPLNGAATAAAQGIAGLSASTVAAGTSAAGMAAQILNNKNAIGAYDLEIVNARSGLADLSQRIVDSTQRFGSNAEVTRALKSEYSGLSATTRGLVAEKAQLLLETRGLSEGLKASNVATAAAAVSTGAAAQAATKAGEATGFWSKLASTHTTQISTQNTALSGNDAIVQALIRSMGGISVLWALAIPIVLHLGAALFKLGDAKKEQIKLDFDQIQADTQRWQSMNTGTLFTKEYATVLHDINAINAQVKRSSEELSIARVDEADAIRKSTTAYTDYAANTDNVTHKIAAYVVNLFASVKGENEATAARLEKSKAMGAAVEMEIKAAAASGKTIAQLIIERQQAGATAAELGLLASAWGQAVAARSRYDQGRSALSTLKLELAQSAAERGEILKGAGAIKVLNEAIGKLPEEQKKLVQQSQLTEKSLSALNATTTAHARGAGVARAAISQYADGVMGLGKAYDTVIKALGTGTFDRIFEELPKKMQKAAKDTLDAAKAILPNIKDVLKSLTVEGTLKFNLDAKALDPTASSLKALGDTGVAQFKKIGEAAASVEEELIKIKLAAISLKPVFEIPFTTIYDSFGRVTEGGQRMSEAVAKAGGTIKVTFDDVSKIVTESSFKQIEAMNSTSASVEEWARIWIKSLSEAESAIAPLPPGIDTLRAAVKQLKDDIASSPIFEEAKLRDETARAMEGVVDIFIRQGERIGETQDQINQRVLAGMAKFKTQLPPEMQEAADLVVDAFKRGMNRLPGALDEIVNKLALGAKQQMSGIFEVIEALPGKFGDSLRKTTNTITDWINRIDGILKGLHKIFASVPDGLAGAITQVINVFKGVSGAVAAGAAGVGAAAGAAGAATAGMAATTAASTAAAAGGWASLAAGAASASITIQGAAHKAGDAVDAMNKKTQGSVSKLSSALVGNLGMIAGAIGGIGMVLGVQGLGRVQGTLQGALGGLTAGASIGFMFGGPVGAGIGALIGGIGGALAGFFGSGKTAAQKAAEAQQAEQVRMNGQQTGQNIINSYLDGVSKALDLAPKIAEFEGVSKAQINKVFQFMTRIVTRFLDTAKLWTSENLKKGQEVAEAIGPVFAALAAVPQAATAMNATFDVPDTQIDLTFSILDRIVARWSARAEQWGATHFVKIKKIAERIAPAINLFAPLIQAITDTQTVKEPTDEQLGVIDRSLEKIITMVGNLATKFAKPFLKALENLAEKVGPAQATWKEQVDLMKATFDVSPLRESDADNVVSGMRLFLDKLVAGFGTFNTEGLGRIIGILGAITPVAAALKVWLDVSAAAKDYTELGAALWDSVAADFDRAVDVVNAMATRGLVFEQSAKTFQAYIASGAASLATAFTMLAQIMNAAGSFFPNGSPAAATAAAASTVPSSVGPTAALPSGPSFNRPFSRTAPSGFGAPSAAGGNVTIQIGDVYLDGQRAPADQAEEFAEKLRDWFRRKQARALSMSQQIPGWALE